jgi:hypothetical protein
MAEPKWAANPAVQASATVEPQQGADGAADRLPNLPRMNIEPPTPIEQIGRGVADFTEGATQMGLWLKDAITGGNSAQQFTQERTDDQRLYEKGRGEGAGIDWWRMTGNAATVAPAMLIPGGQTLGAKIAGGAAIGGATAGGMFTPEGGNKAIQTGIGAVTGAVAPVVGEAVGNAVSKVVQTVKDVPGKIGRSIAVNIPGARTSFTNEIKMSMGKAGVDWNSIPKALQSAMTKDAEAMFKATGKIDAEALLRKAAIEAVAGEGMATTAQITRNPAQWTAERNLQKVTESEASRRITTRYQQQDSAMRDYGTRVGQRVTNAPPGKAASTPFQASEEVIDAVGTVFKQTGDDVSAAYKLGREAFGNQADLPVTEFSKKVTTALDTFSDVIPDPIKRRLEEFGFSRMGPTKATKALTVEEGDKLLKLINARYTAGQNKPLDASLDAVRGALKDAMLELGESGNASASGFRAAWNDAAQRFRMFEPKPIAEAVRGTADAQRFMQTRIMSGNPNDINALRNVVTQAPGGEQAWNTLRGQVWQSVIDDATSQGRGAFNGAAFDRALNKLGPDRLQALFPDFLPQIETLRKAALAMTNEPAFAAPNRSNTASTFANWMLRYAPDVPVIGPMVGKPLQNITTNVQASNALAGNVVDNTANVAAQQARAQAIADLLRRGGNVALPVAGSSVVR